MLSRMLKNYRRRYDISQDSVAYLCKMKPIVISNYEKQILQPTLEDIIKICRGLGWNYTVKMQLMEWLSAGGIYYTKETRNLLNDEAMQLIRGLEKRYGNLTKTPDDVPELLRVQEIVGVYKEDNTDD